MPARKAATLPELRKLVREHEALEEKLYTALISDHITRGTDIRAELWDYAERMMGCIPEGDQDAMELYDDD